MTSRSNAPQAVVVDTNILFSALLAPDTPYARTLLTDTNYIYYICETVIVEVFEHRDKLLKISKLSLDDLLVLYHLLLRQLTLFKESLIKAEHKQRAMDLCARVDPEDAIHVALAFELDALLWTGDKKLRDHLREQGFDRFFVIR